MSRYIPKATRALDVWRAIQGNSVSLVFRKPNGTDLAAQTVRLEYISVTDTTSAAGQGTERRLFIFGVRDHPTVTNTNIAAGYRFNYLGKQYTVLDPIVPPGGGEVRAEVQAV
jgi:hypothetical protein